MKIEKAKSFWNWLFHNKWYYIVMLIHIFLGILTIIANRDDTYKTFSPGSIIFSSILFLLVYAIPFYIYWKGFKANKKKK